MAKTLPSSVSSECSIPNWGAKILHASRPKHQNTKQKKIVPITICQTQSRDFPGGSVVEHPPADAGDIGSIPGPGRSHQAQRG